MDLFSSHLLQELVDGVEMAGNRERFEYGSVGNGRMRKAWLLRCPVEETKS